MFVIGLVVEDKMTFMIVVGYPSMTYLIVKGFMSICDTILCSLV